MKTAKHTPINSRSVTFSLTPAVIAHIKKCCKQTGQTKSAYVTARIMADNGTAKINK